MSMGRLALGVSGVLLAAFGGFRLVTEIQAADLIALGWWLVAALLLHDGVLAPLTLLVGVALVRFVRPRARRYLAGALVVGVGITVVAVPLIWRRGSQPAAKVLLQQNYAVHLVWLWVGIGGAGAGLYLLRVLRDLRHESAAHETKVDS